MRSEHMYTEQPTLHIPKAIQTTQHTHYRIHNQENTFAALALMLGPETDDLTRKRATRRLQRQGPAILPLLLTTLNTHPEITSPPWPWHPPQYEHCSRLLLHLCQSAHVQLETLPQHPVVSQPVGPVLWTSIIEAAALVLHTDHENYEALLCAGLASPWNTTRYAAAMALAKLTATTHLLATTVEQLRSCQREQEALPLRLAASYALLRNKDPQGVEVLMQLMAPGAPEEARKATAFVLATEPPTHLSPCQRQRLISLLIITLQDQNGEIGLHAAHALSQIALPSTLPSLSSLLNSPQAQVQIATLTALEEMATHKPIRQAIYQHTIPTRIVPLLMSAIPEVRRQASYTLAACGRPYAAAVLASILLNSSHPGHIEAIAGLRLLSGVLRLPIRTHVVRWLLYLLRQPDEEVQVTALDSLAYLIWQARTRRQKKAYIAISHELLHDGTPLHLLQSPYAWVRQRTIELLSMLDNQPEAFHTQLLHLLHFDNDSGVRACIAYTLGQLGARSAIPHLIHTLLDEDEHVAQTALNTLGQLASTEDTIVVYVLKELARGAKNEGDCLAHNALRLLKKWMK